MQTLMLAVWKDAGFQLALLVALGACVASACPWETFFLELRERAQAWYTRYEQYRTDLWLVVRMMLSVLMFALISQLLLAFLSNTPESHQPASSPLPVALQLSCK